MWGVSSSGGHPLARGTCQSPRSHPLLAGTPAYLLLRKPIASSVSSPSTSSLLSTGPGSFHGKGGSRLSGAGKSQRKASRKPGISSAVWLLCGGTPEAMPRACRGVSAGIPGGIHSKEREGQQTHEGSVSCSWGNRALIPTVLRVRRLAFSPSPQGIKQQVPHLVQGLKTEGQSNWPHI